MLGTELLTKIFEAFSENRVRERAFRRLYCESGTAARKAHRYVSDNTRRQLEKLVPKCKGCRHMNVQVRTAVFVLEELAAIGRYDLLKEAYVRFERNSANTYKYCDETTRNAIRHMLPNAGGRST